MSRLYLILGTIIVAAGIYLYGHHNGWNERDAEMQAVQDPRVREKLTEKEIKEYESY